MSTTDPGIAARARRDRRPSTVRIVVVLALLLIGGIAEGYGWGGFGEAFDDAGPALATVIAIPVGMIVTILAAIAWTWIVVKRAETGLAYGAAAVLFGGGVGVLGAVDDRDDAFVLHIVGAALIALGAIAFALGYIAANSRARSSRRDDQVKLTGTETTATVTDKGYVIFRESTRILTTVTFTFTDTVGVQRWVQRPMLIRAESPLQNGDETRLWYDPARPGDDKSIVVEAAVESPWRGRR